MDSLCFLLQIGTVVEFSGYFQHSCIEHVGGIVDILDEIVRFRPFDENPLFQVLEQLVLVLVSGEIVEQCVYLRFECFDHLPVVAACEVLF